MNFRNATKFGFPAVVAAANVYGAEASGLSEWLADRILGSHMKHQLADWQPILHMWLVIRGLEKYQDKTSVFSGLERMDSALPHKNHYSPFHFYFFALKDEHSAAFDDVHDSPARGRMLRQFRSSGHAEQGCIGRF